MHICLKLVCGDLGSLSLLAHEETILFRNVAHTSLAMTMSHCYYHTSGQSRIPMALQCTNTPLKRSDQIAQ